MTWGWCRRCSVPCTSGRNGIRLAIDFEAVGLEGVRLPPAVETALYRIAQEALTNVIQHACANNVSLLLAARAGTVTLIVEDDGCGFDTDRLMHGPTG